MKPVDDVYTKTKSDNSSVYTLAKGSEIKFYQIPAYSNTNFSNSSLSHLWGNFDLRTEVDFNDVNLPFSYGGFLGTALENLPNAFYSEGCVMFSVPNDSYRVMVDGSNIAFKIPLNSSYSGITSGLTATTLYSSFAYNSEYLKKDPNSLCAGVTLDSTRSEPTSSVSSSQGIGFRYTPGKNPNDTPNSEYKLFDSGLVYLFTDSIYKIFTGATGSSVSWGYQWNQKNKFQNGKRTFSFSPSMTTYAGTGGYDLAVGVMFLNSGVGFIWDPDLVKGLDWSSIVGDPTTITGATFNDTGSTIFNASDWDFSKELNVKMIMKPDEWPQSSNSSFIGTGVGDCGIASTAITLHGKRGECLAIVKTDEALIKYEKDYVILDVAIPLSEQIQSQTRTLDWIP